MIHQSSLELVGGTPLLQLNNWMRLHGLKANVIAKIEALKAAKAAGDEEKLKKYAYLLLSLIHISEPTRP